MRTAITVVCLAALAAGAALGQEVISAKAGMIHYIEGTVLLDGKQVEPKFAEFPQIPEKSVLASTEGRAEVLLGPGTFLRIGENSEFVLLSNRLTDTRLELKRGSAVVDILEIAEGNAVTLLTGDAVISFEKAGVYRLDAVPGRLLVYDGEALVEQKGQVQRVKSSRMLLLNGVAVAEKFDNRTGDSLLRWAKRRDESIAMANISSARYATRRGIYGSSGWSWNPWFGMFTFVPYGHSYNSFWGMRFWSPQDVYVVYMQPATRVSPSSGFGAATGGWHPTAGGYNSMPVSSSGSSGVVTSTATAGASNSSAPPASTGHPGGGGSAGRGR